MKVEPLEEQKIEEPTIPLKSVQPGQPIRFAHDSLEECFKNDLFWMRMDCPEVKDRVRLVNFKDGKQIERDGDHRCVPLVAILKIKY